MEGEKMKQEKGHSICKLIDCGLEKLPIRGKVDVILLGKGIIYFFKQKCEWYQLILAIIV